jgi:hypothetical protein
MLVILENLGKTGSVSPKYMLSREQFYLNIIFKNFPTPLGACSSSEQRLIFNNSPTAGSTAGFKHKPDSNFIKNRLGTLNPMGNLKTFGGKQFSPEFLQMQKRNKVGDNNPNFGKIKSAITLGKITKLIYVYNFKDLSYIGSYPTVVCSKTFKIGKTTLAKYVKLGLPYKGKLYLKSKLQN